MCLICVLYEQGKMTKKEVDRALAELVDFDSSDEDILHIQEVLNHVNKE